MSRSMHALARVQRYQQHDCSLRTGPAQRRGHFGASLQCIALLCAVALNILLKAATFLHAVLKSAGGLLARAAHLRQSHKC